MSIFQDGVGTFQYQFNTGASIFLVILVLLIALVLGHFIHQGEDPGSRCLYRFEGRDEEHTLWPLYVKTWRGSDYYANVHREGDSEDRIEELRKVAKSCLVTIWGFLHFIMYAILGFLCPFFFWPFFLMGLMWELAETFFDCHCALDLGWNLAGLVTGVALRQYFFPVSGLRIF
ncbi:Hypothetical protein POVN_LOCUS667 [uncultured virus]|nr:Hypothetical protein POVN_LOCUS667 [uncultured virus]